MNGMIVQAIANVFNFLLFLFVLIKFAGPTVQKFLRQRHDETMAMIREAEEAKRQADAALVETQRRLSGVDAELADLLKQARAMAAEQGETIAQTAALDAERLKASAKGEIDRERQAAVSEIRQLLMQQAFDRATAELQQSMNPERQRQLVAGLIQKVGDGSLALQ